MLEEINIQDDKIIYNNIKEKLIKNESYSRVKDYSKNRNTLKTYYEVGKLLGEVGKHYGEGIIKQYSIKLTNELGKKYSVTTLKYMRQFYYLGKSQPLADQLTWSHYIELLLKEDGSLYIMREPETENYKLEKLEYKNIVTAYDTISGQGTTYVVDIQGNSFEIK